MGAAGWKRGDDHDAVCCPAQSALATHVCIRNAWYVAGLSADFPKEKLTGHVIAKRPVVIWRTRDGNIVAYDDRCAHKRFPCRRDG
jgi:phenylpropionate dioxygenase-like ring-hydroxylating dioxygenase large terminal subunit